VLTAEEIEATDGGEIDTEALLAAQMAARAAKDGVTYVAFTATPKPRRWSCSALPQSRRRRDEQPVPFHVYSMRQAIEEGFILDVLKNYTPYKLAFKLANNGEEWDEREVEKSTAMKGSCAGCACTPTTSPEGAGGGRALPRKRAAAAGWQSQGHGGGGQSHRGGALAEGDHRYIKSQGYRMACWWPSRASEGYQRATANR
jgi:hypothetical protein